MDHEHPIEQATDDAQHAEAQWTALLARLQSAPQERERLVRVRHAIACGEFHVDARVIAERLLAQWQRS